MVRALSARRGPALEAAGLYEERPESSRRARALALQLKSLHWHSCPRRAGPPSGTGGRSKDCGGEGER